MVDLVKAEGPQTFAELREILRPAIETRNPLASVMILRCALAEDPDAEARLAWADLSAIMRTMAELIGKFARAVARLDSAVAGELEEANDA